MNIQSNGNKINLASGQRPFKAPWINVDLIEQFDGQGNRYPLDIQTDAKDLSMFPDESVSLIVAHHLFEHIAIHDHDAYISEWRRVLTSGGILAIFVPNIREMDKAWLEGRVSTFIHNVNTYGAYQGHVEDLHKWAYDWDELRDRVSGWDGTNKKYPWAQVRGYQAGNPIYAGADIAQDWWILSMEFVK